MNYAEYACCKVRANLAEAQNKSESEQRLINEDSIGFWKLPKVLAQMVREDFEAFKDIIGIVARKYRDELQESVEDAEQRLGDFGHADYINGAEFANKPEFEEARKCQRLIELFDDLQNFC